jgi:hypothetical protein
MRPYLKKTLHKKRAGGMAQGVDPEFKPHYCKNKQTKETPKVRHMYFCLFYNASVTLCIH